MFKLEGFVTNENFIGAVDGIPIRKHAYSTNDAYATIETAGYFNALRDKDLIRKGDLIEVAGDRDGTPFHSSYIFASVPATGDVTITEHKAVTQNVIHEVPVAGLSSKAADAVVHRHVATFKGKIEKIYTVLNAALATGDATVTAAINGAAVTNGVVTIANAGSGAGTVDSASPTAANSFDVGDVITLTVGGASTATGTLNASLQLAPA